MIYLILIAAIATLAGVAWLLGRERLHKLVTIAGILTLRLSAWLKVQLLAMPSQVRKTAAWTRDNILKPASAAARKAMASMDAKPRAPQCQSSKTPSGCWLCELPGKIIIGWKLIFLHLRWYTVGHRAERIGILPLFRFLATCVGGIASVAVGLFFIAAALTAITAVVIVVTYLAYRGTPPDIMAEWLRVFQE